MDTVSLIFLFAVFLFLVFIVVIMVLNSKSYKNKAWIARQTGNNIDDVIWIEDKFRVVNKDGAWGIQFKRLKDRTRSVDGKFWTKLAGPKAKSIYGTEDDWRADNMKAQIIRGLFLYETTEGEFYPMTIKHESGKFFFGVLDQDNRQFVISETQAVNDLTRSKKQEITLLWGIIIGIVVLALVFFGGMWWQGREHNANLAATAEVCSSYAREVVNITSGGNPTYLSSLTQKLGG